MGNIKTTNLPIAKVLENGDDILVNADGDAKRIDFGVFLGLVANWENISGKPFENYDSTYFAKTAGTNLLTFNSTTLSEMIHTNRSTIDKFGINNDGKLTWDNIEVSNNYELPTASTTILGGIKIDGDTITVDENGIASANGGINFTDLQAMLLAGNCIEIIPDTKNNTLTVNTKGKTITTYSNNTTYAVGDVVIYENDLYARNSEGADTVWTNTNWTKLTEGTNGENAYVHIKYSAVQPTSDADISDIPNAYMGIYSGNSSIAPTTYSNYTWFKIKGEQGITGAKGADGADGSDGDSAYEVALANGYTGTVTEWLASLKGADGITTVTSSAIDLTGTLLATGWSDTAPYSQTITIIGLSADDNPILDIVLSETTETAITENLEWGYLSKAITADNALTVTCLETCPTVNLNIIVKVV